MPQTCKTCSHPKRAEIEKALVGKLGIPTVSVQFGVPQSSLKYHKKVHLHAIIQEAEAEAKQQIVDQILQYRIEVHYAPLDKVKMMQDRVLTKLETADDDMQVPLIREFRGYLQEEFKLGGHYQQDKPSPVTLDAVARKVVESLRAEGMEQEAINYVIEKRFPDYRKEEGEMVH